MVPFLSAPPRSLTLTLVLSSALLSGCFYSVTYTNGGYYREGVFLPNSQPGPPPPTIVDPPVEGLELAWNAQLGAYEVVGHTATYYRLRHFYRCHEGSWQSAEAIDGPWSTASREGFGEAPLPRGLEALTCPPLDPEPST